MSTSIEKKHHHINETTASNSSERGFHGFSAKERKDFDFDLNEPVININLVPISQVCTITLIYLFIRKKIYLFQ